MSALIDMGKYAMELARENSALAAQVEALRDVLGWYAMPNRDDDDDVGGKDGWLWYGRRAREALALTPDTPEEETKYRLFVQQLDAYQVNEIIDLVTKHYKDDIGREACQEELIEFFNRSVLPMPEAAREWEQKRGAVMEDALSHVLLVGEQMSNICFNGKQQLWMQQDYIDSMARCNADWEKYAKVARDALRAVEGK